MTPSRKRPGVAFWEIVVAVVALLYPISLGPACWASSHLEIGAKRTKGPSIIPAGDFQPIGGKN